MRNQTANEINVDCGICAWTPDNAEYRFVFETPFWRIVLAPNQALLGRCVVHLKRHLGDLADLTPDELLEWLTVVQRLERALQTAFGATLFNWSCYMNHAYREEPPNPHIHWWAVPRYKQPVTFGGVIFDDPHFGNPYDHYRRFDVANVMSQAITEHIQQALPPHSAT